MMKSVYVNSAISIEAEPDYRKYFSPMEARRMGRLMKMAVAASSKALEAAGMESTDAIITGTGLGSVECTENFLLGLCGVEGYDMKPTNFMQSTHNTISSLIAIRNKNHGYNSTYAQRGISFESALLDGYSRILLGDSSSVMAGCYEQLTPRYTALLSKIGKDGSVFRDCAVSTIISDREEGAICRLAGVKLLYKPGSVDIPEDALVLECREEASARVFCQAVEIIRKGARKVVIKNDAPGGEVAITILEK